MNKLKTSDFVICLVLGAISKYLDTIAVDESWWANILHYFGNLFTRLGIWILIATIIAAYSKTLLRAAINTFLFFLGMLISYYLYSAYLFGFFPTRYFMFWGSIALVSPILAIIVWKAKNRVYLAFVLPALPMGLLLYLSLGMGLFYVYLSYIEEFIMYVVLCVIFYKGPRQMAASVVFSFVIAFIINQVSPFYF
ncbi:hypothetical protein GW626_06210 [Peribacillus muralis]|uniref:hypothetical protein n=1 Tax=Peribacillus muralis TaxID=264697 RepID=UPI001F4D9B28|nr:hypothetical protein [Peribacillus muralis]MCK1992776.1 hypothetical protein [Peribacillus muralis]MCK2013331.1 hypothetical protein [Peribacillus muralis]